MSTVCRMCLTGGGNVTLRALEDVRLQDVYKKLTDTQFHSEDGRPRVVCSLCYQNLLRCRTLSEMSRISENIISNLLLKGLEATHETIENLNLGPKQHLLQLTDLDYETHKNSSAIIIKEEPMSVKDEETVQVDDLVDTESADTLISEEYIKSRLIFEEGSENENDWIESPTEINNVKLNLETDTEKLDSDQKQSQIQKIEVHPDKIKTYCCDICRKVFLVRSKLVSHIQLSHSMEQQCTTIHKKLIDSHCKTPKRVHTGVKPYACTICDKQFKYNCHVVRHMRIHTREKSHVCSTCDKQFYRKSDLVKHMRIHTGVKPHVCSICDKMFRQKSKLIKHIRIYTREKPYACSICDKQFNEKYILVRHMRVHTGVKPHTCSTCDKQFNEKSILVRHIRGHTGVKPHACSTCNKQFKEKSSLVSHMRIHTGVKPHACVICNKQFYRKSDLVKHMRIHTGIKPYACSTCDKQFNEKSNLVKHMSIHTGVKPYACSTCDKQFTHKSNLLRHMRGHTGVKPYACSTCDKQFTHKSYLVKHMRVHTGV